MLFIYSYLKVEENMSKGPSGLLKWIINTIEKYNIDYKLVSNVEELKKLKNESILIYPRTLYYDLKKYTKLTNKIIVVGPDSHTIQLYSVIFYYLPFLRKILFIKLIKNIFCICLDDILRMRNNINLLVGFKDVKFLNSSGGKYKELTHPFLSSTKLNEPLLPEKNINNDLVIIGKLKGLPVAFRNIEKSLNNFLIPQLKDSKRKLYIFESTGLNLSNINLQLKNIKIIRTNEKLPSDFFKSKIILNMAICGGGTANRALSALFDGGYLFSTEFGMRNINIDLFKNRIKISSFYPFEKKFYDELLATKFKKNSSNDSQIIKMINENSEKILFEKLI